MSLNKRIVVVVISFFVVIFLAFIAITLYTKFNIEFPCIFHELTGKYCAGCGTTRALFALKELNFYQAFRYNMFVFVVFPFLAIYCLTECYYWVLNRKNRFDNIFCTVAAVILVGLLTYGILRNISVFSWLAPTDVI